MPAAGSCFGSFGSWIPYLVAIFTLRSCIYRVWAVSVHIIQQVLFLAVLIARFITSGGVAFRGMKIPHLKEVFSAILLRPFVGIISMYKIKFCAIVVRGVIHGLTSGEQVCRIGF